MAVAGWNLVVAIQNILHHKHPMECDPSQEQSYFSSLKLIEPPFPTASTCEYACGKLWQ
jgi:hypothetical protein